MDSLDSKVSAPERKGSVGNTNDSPLGRAPSKSPEGFGGSGTGDTVPRQHVGTTPGKGAPDGFAGGLISGKC